MILKSFVSISILLLNFAYAGTLDTVKDKKIVRCGVSTGIPGFSAPDSKGVWQGIDVDVCRAVAAAVLGDASKTQFNGLSAQQRFTALQSGEIDILPRNTTLTLGRDTSMGLNFAPTIYYDGQGFMVRKKSKILSAKKLNGATICIQQGTTTELNVTDYFRTQKMKLKTKIFESLEEAEATFLRGQCDAYTTDASGLAALRSKVPNPDELMILPDVISKEPLAPAVRHGDDQWYDIVKWTIYALFAAEELGITSANIDSFKTSEDPQIKRLLGIIEGNGKALGLSEKWAYDAIKAVGNYGEIFERNVGKKSPLKLERGLNSQWNKGGLIYAPPLR